MRFYVKKNEHNNFLLKDNDRYDDGNLAIIYGDMEKDFILKRLNHYEELEKRAEEIKDWFVDNKDCLMDAATNISTKRFEILHKDELIDDVDLDSIVEDIVDEIQKGILNVLDTFDN